MYTVKILEDKEFDKLPYKKAKTALGCADPKTKTAYVRNTHWGEVSKSVNLLTIQHELDELVARTSPHEVDGIRYKDDWVSNILTTDPFGLQKELGRNVERVFFPEKFNELVRKTPVLGDSASRGWMGSVVQHATPEGREYAASTKGQTHQKYEEQIIPLIAYSAGAGSALSSGAAKGAAANQAGYAATAGQYGATGAGTATGSAAASGASGVGASSGLWGNVTSKVGGVNVGQSGSTTAYTAQGSQTSMLSNPMKSLGLAMLGGSALPTQSETPQIGSTVSKWLTADTVTKAGALSKNIADVEYLGDFQLSKETQAYSQVMEKDIRRGYAQRRTDIDKMSSVTNPNWTRSGERLELFRRMTEDEQREVDRMQAEWINTAKQDYAKRQYDYVMQNLAADEQTKRDLLYGELSDIMMQYNIEQADLLNFRQMAADAGMYLLAGRTTAQ